MTVDPYLDPDSGVLRNELRISDRLVLRQAEDDLAGARMAVIAEDASLPAEYGWPLLSAIHALLFADVYEWAGTLRTVGISKDAESQFTPPESLTAELEAFEALLADTLTNSAEKISSGTSPSCTGRSTTSTLPRGERPGPADLLGVLLPRVRLRAAVGPRREVRERCCVPGRRPRGPPAPPGDVHEDRDRGAPPLTHRPRQE